MKEKIINIVRNISPSAAEYTGTTMMEDGVLDSIEIMTIVTDIEDEFEITIPPELLVPEYFESIDTIVNLVGIVTRDEK